MSFDLSRLPLLVWGRCACHAGFEREWRWFWVLLPVTVECGDGAMKVWVDFVVRWFQKDGGKCRFIHGYFSQVVVWSSQHWTNICGLGISLMVNAPWLALVVGFLCACIGGAFHHGYLCGWICFCMAFMLAHCRVMFWSAGILGCLEKCDFPNDVGWIWSSNYFLRWAWLH